MRIRVNQYDQAHTFDDWVAAASETASLLCVPVDHVLSCAKTGNAYRHLDAETQAFGAMVRAKFVGGDGALAAFDPVAMAGDDASDGNAGRLGEVVARRSSAEHLIATKALRCTATAWMLTVAESFA